MLIKKLLVFWLITVLVFAGCTAKPAEKEQEQSEPSVSAESKEETENEPEEDPYSFFGDAVSEEEVKENIFTALGEVNIEIEKIKDFEKFEDENGELKYRFTYRNEQLTVSMDEDFTVASIKIGENGEDIYLKGFESYDSDDYIIPEYMNKKAFLNFADNVMEMAFESKSYEFSEDFTVTRENDYYHLAVNVTVEGSEEHFLEITCYYDLAENTIYMEYVAIDGKVFSNFSNKYVKPERQPSSGE